MSSLQSIGWALVASAGLVSSVIVGLEIAERVAATSPESSETLPVIGVEPVDD